MKLSLIRHGITEGNIKRLYYGSTDIPLHPDGLKKLLELKEVYVYPAGEAYYTSGMRRAEESFAALYGEIPHGTLPEIKEVDFGDFEMRTYEDLRSDPAYIEWITGDNEANICPNGESGNIVTDRAVKALEALVKNDRDAVCVTHGGVIGGVLSRWFPSANGRYEFTPEPGHGFTVTFENGRPISYERIPYLKKGTENEDFV